MCTASWLLEENGYHLFFNRDEQKGRAEAELPRKFIAENGTQYLMPVDPVGQGSWIATNEYGLTLCLLNYYQGETPKGELISRGQLVKTFAHHRYSEELVKAFVTLCFERYAPFTLVIFDSQLNLRKGHVKALQWDGKTLVDSLPLPPLISSAVDADSVRSYRREAFNRYNIKEENVQTRLDFHHSHNPHKGHLSACMHRDDAHTVSFTHVYVSSKQTVLKYQQGSPCQQSAYQNIALARVKSIQKEKFA